MGRNRAIRMLATPVACALLWCAAGLPATAAAEGGAAPGAEVAVTWGARIPLRDGVALAATIYRPAGATAPLPVIFTLTPYIADSYHDRAWYFARNGYVFALVDVRGRGNSEGEFEPFANEGRDGHDVVEWLAGQPFSNGKVAMWGGSYAGFDQWAALGEFPPHLATIVPAAAAHPGVDFPFLKNIFYAYDAQWLTFTSGVASNAKLFGESAYWTGKFFELAAGGRPFAELDRLVGNPSAIFQKWLANPVPGPYWDAMAPDRDDYARIAIPILTITGHYDDDQPGAMAYYRRHMESGAREAIARHFLVIGPWDHAGTRTPKAEVGGLRFGDASLVDLNQLHREWYDWTMKDGARPAFLKQRVAWYMAGPGAESWKYADSLEQAAGAKRTLYLHSDGRADDLFHSGALAESLPNTAQAPDRFVYDPRDLRYAGLERTEDPDYLTSQRHALNRFGNGLYYHSAPLEAPAGLTGSIRATLYLSMDVPDTDLQATLYEIRPEGSSVLLGSDLLRARYRDSLRAATLVAPGAIHRYSFDGFPFVSRLLEKGSRLRLVVNAVDSIAFERNRNSGGAVSGETAADARIAHIALHHDAAHASLIEVPIGAR